MRKTRLAALSCGGFVLGLIACGEVLGEDDPLGDAGTEDAVAESQTSEAGAESSTEDSPASIDAPTCDVNLLEYDPMNCGACGRTCESPTCDAGGCEPSSVIANYANVAQKNIPGQIAFQSGVLYVADTNNAGAGSGVIRCGEPPETKTCNAGRMLFRPDINEIALLDASVVYAAPHNSTFESYDGGVGAFPLDAAADVDAMAKDDKIISARSVAVLGGATVLVATIEGVKRCNGACTNLVQVTGKSADWVVADAKGYCYSGVDAANARGVFCADTIAAAPDKRASVTSLSLPRLALAGDDVVWTEDGRIGTRKRSGAPLESFMSLGTTVNAIDPIIADDAVVTWAHQNFIYRCPRSGCIGDPTILAITNLPQRFLSLASIGKWLYFGEQGPAGARVLRIPK